ncbi:MAG TPA: adenylate/guanylate cyclase domain-containing protein [Candidatus Limnocylindria bacterium]|nr:adenylate/guanylate cyclase domain-containing protein [Candidatus Limnocylindria bacterium]
MARFQHKRVDQPDEVRPFPLGSTEIFEMDDFVIGRMTMEPGWRWTKDVRPIAGTERCQYHHLGYCLSGTLSVEYEDGTTGTVHAGEMFEMPPGHDAWVDGDEPWIAIDFRGARSYARPMAAGADRVLATVLFTDIVNSTEQLRSVGDSAWRDLVGQHNEMTKFELDRYRGRLIKQTGDGVVALFDGAARAVECAAAIAARVQTIGLQIRAGVHTGEVELVPEDVWGVAVHLASRIMNEAAPGEVVVSAVSRELLAGSHLAFESRGRHALKGIDGERELFALVGPQ